MDWNLDGPAGQVWKIAPDCVGESFCDTPGVDAGLNSTGETARTCATGSLAVDENALWLYVDRLPEHQIGYFLASRTSAGPFPVGHGFLCLGVPRKRFAGSVQDSGARRTVPLSNEMPSVNASATRRRVSVSSPPVSPLSSPHEIAVALPSSSAVPISQVRFISLSPCVPSPGRGG